MEEYIMKIINDMSQDKANMKVAPTSVLMSEIKDRMVRDAQNTINRLCKERRLTFHRTLNDISFDVTATQNKHP